MKGNNTIPIGGELESKATNKVVVSAEGVRDYKRGKSQEQVNDDVLDNYNVLIALYKALDKSDLIITEDHTEEVNPQTNTIYREQGDTSYIDWMWDGVAWRQMATYSNAIDNTPTANSNNLVKSGGVYAAVYDIYAAMRDKLGWSASNTVATVVGSTYQNYIECDIPANKVIHVDVEGSTGLFNTDALTIKFFNGDTVEYNENITLPTWSKDYTIDAQITKVQINRTVNASAVGNITLTVSTSADFATTSEFETVTSRIETKADNIAKSLTNPTSTKSVATVVGSSWYNIFNDVDIPSGTKFSLDISGDTGLWSNNALTVRLYNGSTQVENHNVYYPIVDNNQHNQNITKISVERSANAIAVGTITVTLTIYTSEFYNKSEVDSLVGTNYVYVAPSGSDSGAGTKASPFATVNKALKVSSKVILRGGLYKEQSINMNNTPNNKVTIVNESGEKPCFIGNIITESETKVDGYTKVYKATYSTSLSSHNWLFMYGVNDVSTEITDNKRVYVHGRRDYRCDVTRLFRVNGILEIENCSAYAWYQDGSTLYFSRPQTVNSTHPIFRGYGGLFSNTAEKELHIIGLRTYGKYFNVPSVVNSEVVDCAAVGCFGGYGFTFDNCKNLVLKRCEAAFVETNWTSSTGDGFNVHSTATGADGTIMLSTFSLIDCWAHDNFNDGYSDHECCAGHIIGGCYEFNSCGSDGMGGKSYNSNGKVGHGGGLTPSHGAHDIIENAISQYNYEDGIRYTSDETIIYSSRGTIQLNGVLVRSNGYNGIAVNNIKQIVNAVNCISINNARYGFYCVQDGVLTLFNCKYIGNIVGNVSSDVTIVI